MIFTIQNLGFAIGGFLLEGWLAFAARCVCALVLLALGAVARAPQKDLPEAAGPQLAL